MPPVTAADKAYRLGWTAYLRKTWPDMLGDAEEKFIGMYGEEHWDRFIDGWLDYNADREYGHLLRCRTHNLCP